MRKREMSKKQLAMRSIVIDTLAAAGWEGPSQESDFDRGLWLPAEASMEYRAKNMTLEAEHSAEQKSLVLLLTADSGADVRLVIKCEDKLESVLKALVGFQDQISPTNFREKLKPLLKICDKVFVDTGDEEVPLADEDEE
jgi:hypothetical protein